MRFILAIIILMAGIYQIFPQTDLDKLVETEKSFARTASEKNTKTAFLEFLADDGILFAPTAVNGKESWKSRPDSPALLAWTPAFADISANGILGYTTGPWEFRPKGKNDTATGFGHYVTLWQKQFNGEFKAVLDIGISHPQVALTNNWASPTVADKGITTDRGSAADTSTQFFETAEKVSIEKAYKMFFAEDGRLYRNGKVPFVGKKNAVGEVKKAKDKIRFAKRSIFTSAADLAYISNTYTFVERTGKETEKGNFLQIWKLRNGKWEIVLDLFNPIPKS